MLLKRAFPLILLPVAISHLQVAMAVVYIVGGPAGWDFAPTASYYSDWASENTFLPGDKLSFRYDPTTHNVQQVNMSDYATCNTLNPILQYQSGNDLITLQKPGTYYFICGFSGHCEGGGMLIKLVVAASGPPALQSPVAPVANPLPPVPRNHSSPPPNHSPRAQKSPPPHSPLPPVPLRPRPRPSPKATPQPSPLLFPSIPARAGAYPPAPARAPAPPPLEPRLTSPPPPPPILAPPSPVLASPPSPPSLKPKPKFSTPHYHIPKSARQPGARSSDHRNQTYESPAAPPPSTAPVAAAPPPISAPAPSNDTLAPSPDDFDSDTANARHFGMDLVFAGLVIVSAVIF